MGGAGPGSGHRILIVLGDPTEETLFVDAFQRLHWEVELADDAATLVELLITSQPEIVLTDDLRVVRFTKHVPGTKRTCSIVVLADDRNSAVEAATIAGAEHVIVRPVDPVDPLGFGPGENTFNR
jgi:DNA-binding response OmpR family regulator